MYFIGNSDSNTHMLAHPHSLFTNQLLCDLTFVLGLPVLTYFEVSGACEVMIGKNNTRVAILVRRQFFGESALLLPEGQRKRTATVRYEICNFGLDSFLVPNVRVSQSTPDHVLHIRTPIVQQMFLLQMYFVL